MAIIGMIDGAPALGVLTGWAKDDGSAQALVIEAHLDGTLVANARTDTLRLDVGGPFGFTLRLPGSIDAAAIRDQRLVVSARGGRARRASALSWHVGALAALDEQDVARRLAALSAKDLLEALGTAVRTGAADTDRSAADISGFGRLERLMALPDFGTPSGAEQRFEEPLTTFHTAPGTISPDGAAMIGFGGQVYLSGGTNDLAAQFALTPDDPIVGERVEGWAALFRRRAALLEERGITYVQTVIPEKVGVIPDHWPTPIRTPSATLAALETTLRAEAAGYYVGAYDVLADSPARTRTYRKVDTHLSWQGARLVYDALCRGAGFEPPFDSDYWFNRPVTIGDFSHRFPGFPLVEQLDIPDSWELAAAEAGIEEVYRSVPDPAQHLGAHLRWRNPAAPIDKRVLVFGNSFFEYRLFPTFLSWWFVRTFREFEFVWAYDFDPALIDARRPDIVIGQTVERFLTRVPDA